MPSSNDTAPRIVSARPEMTARLMAETGLDDDVLRTFVHRFYDCVRTDPMLGPVFADRITDWEPHLARMVEFWSSVALMTGRYHGAPVAAHAGLPITGAHFDRWLAHFRQTALDVCPPAGANHIIDAAERIARSLQSVVQRVGAGPDDCPPSDKG